jgi:hypothetical protein
MNEQHNVEFAISTLSPLLSALESAYWEASEIGVKDKFFDLITCVHKENNELAKLRIDDLLLPYEPITPEFSGCCQKLKFLSDNLDELAPRSETLSSFKQVLPLAASLLKHCQL